MIREDVWRRKLILHDAMTITGRVTDTNGKPVAGASISNNIWAAGGQYGSELSCYNRCRRILSRDRRAKDRPQVS